MKTEEEVRHLLKATIMTYMIAKQDNYKGIDVFLSGIKTLKWILGEAEDTPWTDELAKLYDIFMERQNGNIPPERN